MNESRSFGSVPYPVAWPGTPVASHWRHGMGALRNIVAIWEERKRFRLDLARMANRNPHLISDIGLTKRQVEAEIAKPFWRA